MTRRIIGLHRRRLRILELEPVLAPAAAIDGAEPLTDDALKAHHAGVTEHHIAVMGEVFVQAHTEGA
jgi:hypothetical protein